MAAEDEAARSEQEWVVIASFGNRVAAEHMLASLGHEFRRNARKGHAEAFVVSGNADGSLKLTESRALESSEFAATVKLSHLGFPINERADVCRYIEFTPAGRIRRWLHAGLGLPGSPRREVSCSRGSRSERNKGDHSPRTRGTDPAACPPVSHAERTWPR